MTRVRISICALIFAFAHTAHASVFVSEIAWMGTVDSSSNEWMELGNNGDNAVDLSGWVLKIEGKKDISLSGSVGAHGYYLIERTDDSSVPSVTADLITSFGSGLSNSGAVLGLYDAGGSQVDYVDGSDAWKIGGDNTTKDTAQRMGASWGTAAPTPRTGSVGTTTSSTSSSGISTQTTSSSSNTSSSVSVGGSAQMSAEITLRARTGFAGVPMSFKGNAFDVKGEPLDSAHFSWAFGDGSSGDGSSLFHTFYYPGDYTIVLDASSGRYTASARIVVSVSDPALAFRIGGDTKRSFIVVENNGAGELDLSGWQIIADGKTFTIPQNTIAASHKALTFPSEVTGLVTRMGSNVELRFPNGVAVTTQTENIPPTQTQASMSAPPVKAEAASTYTAPVSHTLNTTPTNHTTQKASVSDALHDEGVGSALVVGDTADSQDSSLMWYIATAFFGAFALLGLRFPRSKKDSKELSEADEFTITEEE